MILNVAESSCWLTEVDDVSGFLSVIDPGRFKRRCSPISAPSASVAGGGRSWRPPRWISTVLQSQMLQFHSTPYRKYNWNIHNINKIRTRHCPAGHILSTGLAGMKKASSFLSFARGAACFRLKLGSPPPTSVHWNPCLWGWRWTERPPSPAPSGRPSSHCCWHCWPSRSLGVGLIFWNAAMKTNQKKAGEKEFASEVAAARDRSIQRWWDTNFF